MSKRLISYAALASKGITYSKPTLWRTERAGTSPKRAVGAARYAYVEEEIDAWVAALIASRDNAAA